MRKTTRLAVTTLGCTMLYPYLFGFVSSASFLRPLQVVLAKWARQKTLGLKPVKLVCQILSRKLKALHSNIREPRGEGIPVPERPILKKVEKLWGNHSGFC